MKPSNLYKLYYKLIRLVYVITISCTVDNMLTTYYVLISACNLSYDSIALQKIKLFQCYHEFYES